MACDMDFAKIHDHMIKWEGFISNDKDDVGGLTKFGVSLAFLKSLGADRGDLNRDGIIDHRDVMMVTQDIARDLFRDEFWKRPKIADLPSLLAMATYDAAVNCGAKQAIKFLQRAMRNTFFMDIAVDGIIGRQTLSMAMMAEAGFAEQNVALKAIEERELFYQRLAKKKPSQKKFLCGWLNRCASLSKLIHTASKGNE